MATFKFKPFVLPLTFLQFSMSRYMGHSSVVLEPQFELCRSKKSVFLRSLAVQKPLAPLCEYYSQSYPTKSSGGLQWLQGLSTYYLIPIREARNFFLQVILLLIAKRRRTNSTQIAIGPCTYSTRSYRALLFCCYVGNFKVDVTSGLLIKVCG